MKFAAYDDISIYGIGDTADRACQRRSKTRPLGRTRHSGSADGFCALGLGGAAVALAPRL